MRSEILAAIVCICGTVVAVKYFEQKQTAFEAGDNAETMIAVATPAAAATPQFDTRWRREVRIPAGVHHQYFVTAAVNRRPSSFLVDTGASYVALRESDADAAGVYTTWSDFTHPVRTANGVTKAALVEIRSIEIDGIRVEDVEAFILPDDQLGMNLLGMSFLSKLESVESRGGELVLKG